MDQLFINESNLQDSKNLLKWETLVFKDWTALRLWGWSSAREIEKWYSFLTEQENLAAGRITLVSLWWLCPYSIFPLFMKSVYLGRRLWVLSESTSHSRCLSLQWPRAKQSSAQHSPFSRGTHCKASYTVDQDETGAISPRCPYSMPWSPPQEECGLSSWVWIPLLHTWLIFL